MTPFTLPGQGRTKERGPVAPDMSAFRELSGLIPPLSYPDSLRGGGSFRPIGREPVSIGSLLTIGAILTIVTTVAVIAIKRRMSGKLSYS